MESKKSNPVNEEQVKNFLDDLGRALTTVEESERKSAPDFNVFRYIMFDRDNGERTLSFIIRDLLDPRERHGQGHRFLKSFVEIVIGRNYAETSVGVHPRCEVRTTGSSTPG